MYIRGDIGERMFYKPSSGGEWVNKFSDEHIVVDRGARCFLEKQRSGYKDTAVLGLVVAAVEV
jgi:hypothetical protein